ncbi:unnamed protein product [Effrenium voratum]|nr:unnamed protein product [Effrenium voratum]
MPMLEVCNLCRRKLQFLRKWQCGPRRVVYALTKPENTLEHMMKVRSRQGASTKLWNRQWLAAYIKIQPVAATPIPSFVRLACIRAIELCRARSNPGKQSFKRQVL